jgi:hypothetical protein
MYENNFWYLFDVKKLTSLNYDNLKNYGVNLESFLKHDNFSNLDLFSKLKALQEIFPKKKKKTTDILNFIKNFNCFSNASIAYRILLTIPVTVSSVKRSFSKLKL